MPLFLEPWAKELLLAHAIVAVILLGSAGHLGWESAAYLARGRGRNVKLHTIHARTTPILFAIQFSLGLLVYPTYRVRVRHDVFDVRMPWASNLFDTKEMAAAFGLAAAIAIFVMSLAVRPREEADRPLLRTYAALGVLLCLITFYSAIAGWVLVAFRAI